MSIDGQLFINQHMLRDDDGNVLPVNHYLRALPYKGGNLCGMLSGVAGRLA